MKPFLYNMDFVRSQSRKKLFKVVSTFAGGGGSSTGYRLAGGEVLAINEFIKSACETYQANYPETNIFDGDIRNVVASEILDSIGLKTGELDIFDGSPPCASFSIAGSKEKLWGEVKKYSDTEQRTDDLFFEFIRLLNDIQPRVFICENVAGLTSGASANLLGSDQLGLFGEEQDTIYHQMVNCGYNVRFKVLNAKNFGVPQTRERTIFIGVRKDIKKPITFPRELNEIVTIGEAINGFEELKMNRKAFNEKENRIVKKDGVCFTVVADGLGATRRYKATFIKDGTKETRKFTIDEMKIISGFPSDFKLTGSYSKQWERIGRAVPPIMMKHIAEHVYNTILKD